MDFVYNDGGRKAAGFTGTTGDCGIRAVAIAANLPYREVYDALWEHARTSKVGMRKLRRRYGKNAEKHITPRTGVYREVLDAYLQTLGWAWVPTMHVGRGCTVHLTESELPGGWLIARVSKHFTAVCDGVVHDTHDPSRDGTRCVYGYWQERT